MTVLVSPVRVVRVELGVQIGLEDVGVVGDTDETEKVALIIQCHCNNIIIANSVFIIIIVIIIANASLFHCRFSMAGLSNILLATPLTNFVNFP